MGERVRELEGVLDEEMAGKEEDEGMGGAGPEVVGQLLPAAAAAGTSCCSMHRAPSTGSPWWANVAMSC